MSRMDDSRLVKIARDRKPIGMRSIGRPRRRWRDNLEQILEEEQVTCLSRASEEAAEEENREQIKLRSTWKNISSYGGEIFHDDYH